MPPLPTRSQPLLTDFDLEQCRASGLTEQTIRDNHLRSEFRADVLARILYREPGQAPRSGLVIPYRSLAGEVNCYARVKPHSPRTDSKGKPVKYEAPSGEPPRLFVPAATARRLAGGRGGKSTIIDLSEGEKKALLQSQEGLIAVGISGVYSWKQPGSEALLPELAELARRGCAFIIHFDFDPKPETQRYVAGAMRRLARALLKAGASEVKAVEYPPGPGGGKNAVDDFFVAHGHDALMALRAQAQPVRIATITVTTEEHTVNDQAIEALTADPHIYQRGGLLVHVVRTTKDATAGGIHRHAGAPQITAVASPLLRDRLTTVAQFERIDPKSEDKVPCHPPEWCVAAVLARGQWSGIRYLAGVTDTPILRPDGSILDVPGYDAATGLLFAPGGPLPTIPDHPTSKHVRSAVRQLLEVVVDFPFAQPMHEAAWFAYTLTPLARHAFEGPAPATLVEANVRGAGKGLLLSTSAQIVTGRDMSVTTAHDDEAEMRKAITAAALNGDTMIVIDNVAGALGGATLDAALTTTRWRDRLLGQNKIVDLPLLAVWAATGNNVVLRADTARRVLLVRLDSPEENPEDRRGFQHPNLRAHVRQHRTELLGAALTILRGFCAAGRPEQGLPPWGSFEGWSELVRSAVVWAGLPDPAETRLEVRKNSDPEAGLLPALLAGIERLDKQGRGLTVAEIVGQSEFSRDPVVVAMRDAIAVLVPSRDGKVSPRSLGMKLHHLRGRVVAGKSLERVESKKHDLGTRWLVRPVGRGN